MENEEYKEMRRASIEEISLKCDKFEKKECFLYVPTMYDLICKKAGEIVFIKSTGMLVCGKHRIICSDDFWIWCEYAFKSKYVIDEGLFEV